MAHRNQSGAGARIVRRSAGTGWPLKSCITPSITHRRIHDHFPLRCLARTSLKAFRSFSRHPLYLEGGSALNGDSAEPGGNHIRLRRSAGSSCTPTSQSRTLATRVTSSIALLIRTSSAAIRPFPAGAADLTLPAGEARRSLRKGGALTLRLPLHRVQRRMRY